VMRRQLVLQRGDFHAEAITMASALGG